MRSLESFLQGKFCTEFSKRQTLLNLSTALKCKLHIIFIYAYNSEILNIVNRIKYLFVPYNSELFYVLVMITVLPLSISDLQIRVIIKEIIIRIYYKQRIYFNNKYMLPTIRILYCCLL